LRNFFLFLLAISFSTLVFVQTDFTEKDKEICLSKFQFSIEKRLIDKPINNIISEIGKSFIGVDYEPHTLEKEGDEKLIIHLSGFDCTTFLENVFALSRCIKRGKTTFEDFENELLKIRYREGRIDKYPSRLHYFSDWIYDNSKKSIVEDITRSIGGIICPNKVGFMTNNRDKYNQLISNDEFYSSVKNKETEINSRELYYIPKNEVGKFENKIEDGYLIAITSGIKDLDISHVGIAVKMKDGKIHLLHAPSPGSKVHITKKTLYNYLMQNKNQTGIVVIKPLEPET
jgi:hypothetical protein